MLSLRAYKPEDAKAVASWLTNEQEFAWWSAGHLGAFPLDPDTLNAFYTEGIASGEWFPRTMEEDGRVCGQLLMRRKDEETVHFGFIVVDGSQRGKGYGFAMLSMALEYAFHLKRAKRVTLNVFADNAPAIRCYERLGFSCAGEFELNVGGEKRRAYRYEKKKMNA